MRILEVYRRYLPQIGGIEIDMHEVGRRLHQAGHEVNVVTQAEGRVGGGAQEEVIDGVHVRRIPDKGLHRGTVIRRFHSLFKSIRPDILHVYSFLPTVLTNYAIFYGMLKGVPLVVSPIYHPKRLQLPGFLEGKKRLLAVISREAYEKRLGLYLLGMASVLRCLTEEEQTFFRQLGLKRTCWIPSGIEILKDDLRPAQLREFRRTYQIDEKQGVFLFVGPLIRRKGFQDLMKAARILKDRRPGFVLMVVGANPDGRDHQLDTLNGHIRYLGRLNDEDLLRAYEVSNAVIVPSRYEAYSRVTLEAVSRGRPVIATDAVGLSHMITDHNLGMVVPPANPDRLAEAMETITIAVPPSSIAERALRLVRDRYEWSTVANSMEELYLELLR